MLFALCFVWSYLYANSLDHLVKKTAKQLISLTIEKGDPANEIFWIKDFDRERNGIESTAAVRQSCLRAFPIGRTMWARRCWW